MTQEEYKPVINLFERQIRSFVEEIRPKEEIRHQLDIGYSVKNLEFILFEIRPQWNDESVRHEYPFARGQFIKSRNIWKLYWKRATGKWEPYKASQETTELDQMLAEIRKDPYGCFFG